MLYKVESHDSCSKFSTQVSALLPNQLHGSKIKQSIIKNYVDDLQ